MCTASPAFFSSAVLFASSWISFWTIASTDGFRRGVGDEPLDRHRRLVRRALIGLFLPQLAPHLGSLDRNRLDIVGLDLVVEPGVIADRGLGLRHELIEDQPETAEEKQPEPRRRGRPTRSRSSCVHCSSAAGAGVPVAAVDSPCLLTRLPADGSRATAQGDTAGPSPPDDPCNRIVPRIAQKFRGCAPRPATTS